MSEPTPMEIENLILGYEELSEADKALADSLLKSRPDLAGRLKWHQEKESQAKCTALSRDGFGFVDSLDQADEPAQQESLRRVLESFDRGRKTENSNRLQGWVRWVVPMAAVLALAVLLPHGEPREIILRDLVVTQIILDDNHDRAIDGVSTSLGTLPSGTAFALNFNLEADAYVVVYHVGPGGQVSLVYPESLTGTVSPYKGGMGHQIPDQDSGEVWILSTETGTESFLVATSRVWPTTLGALQQGHGLTDRNQALLELRSQLENTMDQVELYEFEHID